VSGNRRFVLAATLALGLAAAAPVSDAAPAPTAANPLQPFETRAGQALLIDAETQTVLFEKAPDQRMSPASLAKLMTVAVVFDALKAGELRLDDTFTVSDNAWRKGGAPAGGTTMFARPRSTIKVGDLLRGAIVQSANDACIVLAEGMAGSEATFADRMNIAAAKLGLTNTHFANATGALDPGEFTTARDLARLAKHLIEDFPDYYATYREPAFTWNGINQSNRNPLLNATVGGDGLAVGGNADVGFGLVGSAIRDNQRLILVLAGLAGDKERADEAKKLLDWGFRSFEKVTVFGPADVVAEANVFGGDRATVGLVTKVGVDAFLPRGARNTVSGRVVYQGPVKAPIAKGTLVGSIELRVAGTLVRQAPVYAADDVGVGSLQQRAFDGLHELLFSWWPG
jgi:D-alanyl-D-alanine carboxypeptidase (penicillin-binding protein 5/6)